MNTSGQSATRHCWGAGEVVSDITGVRWAASLVVGVTLILHLVLLTSLHTTDYGLQSSQYTRERREPV